MKVILITVLTISGTQLIAQKKTNMKIQPPQAAPNFTVKDVNGATVNLANLKGKKVLLTFYRNVGCPICNLRFHELQQQSELFKSKELVMLSVYESTSSNMKKYLNGETFYGTMIPNPNLSLYQLYNIEKSTGKLMAGMLHGAMGKMNKGEKLYKTKIEQDGSMNRISAEFLINEKGNIVRAFYGKYVGDNLPLTEIIKFLN